MRRKMIGVLSAILFMTFAGCGKKESKQDVPQYEPIVNVKVIEADYGEIHQTMDFSGDIHGIKEVKIFPKVSGKLSRKLKYEGDSVKENEPIAYINRDEVAMNFADAEVRSTIDGILSQYFVGIGDTVFPGQTPIAMISDIKKVVIEIFVTEKELLKLNKNQPVRIKVDAYPDKTFIGRINEIEPVINPATRKSKVKIELDNSSMLLKPGMFADVEIITKSSKNIVVPRNAVLVKNGTEIVYIVDEGGNAKAIHIVSGMSNKDKIEIKSGLKKGDKVIYNGNYLLREGTKVNIIE